METSRNDTVERILDVAEGRMRSGGYAAVSFRDIAADVGIKSASVHYHFPQKADLGEAVVRRYAARLADFLGRPDDPAETPSARLARLCSAYRHALLQEGKTCLCCVLGAELQDLPEGVAAAVRAFFEAVLGWLQLALAEAGPAAPPPALVVSALQGAMIVAGATGERRHFEAVSQGLQAGLRRP